MKLWRYRLTLTVPADAAWNAFQHRTAVTRMTGGDFATGQRTGPLGTRTGDFATGNRRTRTYALMPGVVEYTGEAEVVEVEA